MMEIRRAILVFALVVVTVVSSFAIVYPSLYNGMKSREDTVVGKGTVKYLDFEGGFYGIIGDNGERYDPLNMAEEFQVNGLRVHFEVKILHETGTFHMWGKPVSIVNIQKLGVNDK